MKDASSVVLFDAIEQLRGRLPSGYALRHRNSTDFPFLRQLYAETREEELRPVPWSPEQKWVFLCDQFQKQHEHYQQHYPLAQWWVVTCDEASVGRLYVAQTARDLRIMDLSLTAAHRGMGLGGAMVRALLRHAEVQSLSVSLHVEPFNPAMRLYKRLGFVTQEMRGVYAFMERLPSVENDLVPGVATAATNRHQEQFQGPVTRVNQSVDPLLQCR